MIQHGELVYGLVVAVDIENFSRLDTLDQARAQSRLSEVLDTAASSARLGRRSWYRQSRGDGELAVLPASIDVAWAVADLTDRLAQALAQLRQNDDAGPTLRVRLAMHHGTLTGGHFGPVGEAPIVACHLLDANVVRRALAADDTVDLVLVISEPLYRDVVQTRFHGLDPERFRAVRTTVKGTTYTGYLCTGTPRRPADADLVGAGAGAGAEDVVGPFEGAR
jgi:hypothetical protein